MPPITERGGVKFDEGKPKNFRLISHIDTKINSGFGQDHLKSLRDVKEAMAVEAKRLGGNYIACFLYGQKNGSVLQQLWSLDNVLWYGSGEIGVLED